MRGFTLLGTAVLLAGLAAPAGGQGLLESHPTLTLDGARAVAGAAVAEARRLSAPGGAIAVVDDGGNLLFVERLDNTFAAAATVAIGKARTAALFRRPTKVLEDAIVGGRTTLLSAAETPLQGGIPIEVNGVVVGAIGVSGAASAAQDTEIAAAGAASFGARLTGTNGQEGMGASGVTYLDSKQVATAFERGVPLLEVGEYKIHASRREQAGQAEVHEADTDIVYVLKGSATFVTGGDVVDGTTTATEEIRGASITGGETRRLVPGDVIVVRHGTPHWFKAVQGPFLYFVVKVRTGV